jgi:hypothetical protein
LAPFLLQANEPKLNLAQWLTLFEDSYKGNPIEDTAELFGVPLTVAISLKRGLEKGYQIH